jgi:uncharacterized membrane protein
VPADTHGRIVLFSDGRETNGDSRDAADQLAAAGVPVFTAVEAVRNLGDTWIENVRATDATAGAVTGIDVDIGSQRTGSVVVTLEEHGIVLGRASAQVVPGRTTVPIDVMWRTPGAHSIDARVDADGDVLAANNTASVEVMVAPPPRVLYVQAAGASNVLPQALRQAGLDVTVRIPATLPASADGLAAWDVVVLSDVARAALPAAAMPAIATWVESRGGGLLFAGGGAVFGEGAHGGAPGFRHTDLERLLPVTFEREDTPEVALAIVLDRSWSMSGDALDLCKAAADAAVDALSDAQLIGVITFNDQYEWNVPLGTVRDNRPGIHHAIQAITASGPTRIYPALEQAYVALNAVHARAKHVVLLSDGQTEPDDYEGLARRMAAAKITVSSVALGPEADVALLRNIATWGKGHSYVVQQATALPEIFVREAKNAATPGFEADGAIHPIVRLPGLFHGAAAGALPPLHGRNAVTARPGAIAVVSTKESDPLLTVWPAGLGRTAMFAADVQGAWTADWLAWRGFGAFFATIVRAVARARVPPASLAITTGDADGGRRSLSLQLDARDPAGRFRDLLSPTAIISSRDERTSLGLRQIAPGRYAATLEHDPATAATVSVSLPATGDDAIDGAAAATVTRIVPAADATEYRFDPPDRDALARIARTTGGAVDATAAEIAHASSAPARRHVALTPFLLGAALLFWMVDIVGRRLA